MGRRQAPPFDNATVRLVAQAVDRDILCRARPNAGCTPGGRLGSTSKAGFAIRENVELRTVPTHKSFDGECSSASAPSRRRLHKTERPDLLRHRELSK